LCGVWLCVHQCKQPKSTDPTHPTDPFPFPITIQRQPRLTCSHPGIYLLLQIQLF
jgi:hypothetical protein